MEDRESLLLIDKSFDTLMAETLADLQNTSINDGPGGVARLLLSKVNEKLSTFYDALQLKHTEAFLSKAKGPTLDLIGELLNCTRLPGESDEEYKYRIHQQPLSLEKANETAIRLAVLSVPGVVDVVMREFTHGTGSFSVYPILNDPYTWNAELIAQIKQKIESVKAYGTRAVVMQPRLAYVELKGRLILDGKVSDMDKVLIQNDATQAVRQYINTLKPGEVLEIRKVINLVMNVSPYIMDVEIYHFMINNKAMLPVDQESAWNERFVEAPTPHSILFS